MAGDKFRKLLEATNSATFAKAEGEASPLYVSRKVQNADEIIAWAKANGFDKCVPPEELHVTQVYSKTPMDWTAAGDSFDQLYLSGGNRSVVPLGDKGAVVLKFESGDLQARHAEFMAAGASHDFPSYQPHVTITYDGAGVDLSKVDPYMGTIKLGPEEYAPITEDWSDKLVEKGLSRIYKVDDGLGLVFGWAIVCKIDGEDYYDLNIDRKDDGTYERVPEHITEDAMLKASVNFARLIERPGNEMHKGPDSGHYRCIFPMTTEIAKSLGIETRITGLLVGYEPTPDVLAKYRNGTYTGFSIEGIRVRNEEIPA